VCSVLELASVPSESEHSSNPAEPETERKHCKSLYLNNVFRELTMKRQVFIFIIDKHTHTRDVLRLSVSHRIPPLDALFDKGMVICCPLG